MTSVIVHRASLALIVLATITTAAQAQYRHLGCFADDEHSHDLFGIVSLYNELNLATCAASCRREGYAYVGLQAAKYCYCGGSYGKYGTSNACNFTCSVTQVENCGGILANDVYYTIPLEESSADNSVITPYGSEKSFDEARMDCIRQGGDITTLTSSRDVEDIARSQTDHMIGGHMWLGLRKTKSGIYQWTNPATDRFLVQDFVTWSEQEQHIHSCVLISAREKLLTSADCSERHPFLCTRPYDQDDVSSASTVSHEDRYDDGGRLETNEDDDDNSSKLAFYVVLPLFVLIYGGSCLVYCIYRNCQQLNRKRHRMFEIRSCESLGRSSTSGVQTTSCRSICSAGIPDEQVSIISIDTPTPPLTSPVSSPERRPVTATECAVEISPVGASPVRAASPSTTSLHCLNPTELTRSKANTNNEQAPHKAETSLSAAASSSQVNKSEVAQEHTGNDAKESHDKPPQSPACAWRSSRNKLILPVRSKAHARSRQLPIAHVLREKEAAGVERMREPKIIIT